MEPIKSLLLVEDSDDDIIITQRKLFRSSVKIENFFVAKSLTEAKKIVEERPIDVILLDLNLPESRGLDTLAATRDFFHGVVIVITSIDDEMVGVNAIRQGADDYIVKNTVNETILAHAIFYARERRNIKNQMSLIKNKLSTLSQIDGA